MDHDYDSSAILGAEEDDAPTAGAWSLGELDESSDLESLRLAWKRDDGMDA